MLKAFLTKYAGEALSIAGALNTMLEGLALSPRQSASVTAVIDKLTKAVDSYMGAHPVSFDQATLDKAVDEAVTRAMAAFTKPDSATVA
jgi:hypothetical protein